MNNTWHVAPIDDLKPHCTDCSDCDCKPKIKKQNGGGTIVIHNSYDRRELFEEKELEWEKI